MYEVNTYTPHRHKYANGKVLTHAHLDDHPAHGHAYLDAFYEPQAQVVPGSYDAMHAGYLDMAEAMSVEACARLLNRYDDVPAWDFNARAARDALIDRLKVGGSPSPLPRVWTPA